MLTPQNPNKKNREVNWIPVNDTDFDNFCNFDRLSYHIFGKLSFNIRQAQLPIQAGLVTGFGYFLFCRKIKRENNAEQTPGSNCVPGECWLFQQKFAGHKNICG